MIACLSSPKVYPSSLVSEISFRVSIEATGRPELAREEDVRSGFHYCCALKFYAFRAAESLELRGCALHDDDVN
jgi:hypothetical protein